MNYLQIVTRVVQLADISDAGPSTVTGQSGDYAKAITYVTMAHAEIQGMFFDWKFLWGNATLNTSASTSEYSGASGLHLWNKDRVFYNNDYLDVYEWEDYTPDTSLANGPPEFAVIRPDNQLLIVPTPDASYTITYDYWKEPKVLSANTDEPYIPSEFHDVIVGKALMLFGLHESAPEVLSLGQVIYDYWLAQLKTKELPRRAQTHGRQESTDVTIIAE